MKNIEKFLQEEIIKESTKKAYHILFDKIEKYENENNMKIENINAKDDMIDFIKNVCDASTYNSFYVKMSLLKKYMLFTGNELILEIHNNNLEDIYKDKQINRYISKEELQLILKGLINASDKCLIMLIRNGLGAKQEAEDLINLTINDIDIKNKTVRGKRVDNHTFDLVRQTIEEREYVSQGLYEKISVYNMSSKFLFKTRPTKESNDGLDGFKIAGLRGRLQRIKHILGDDRITLSNLILSYAIDLVLEKQNDLGRELDQRELKHFLRDAMGTTKNIYDVRNMSREVFSIAIK